jgi:hypothetical protein
MIMDLTKSWKDTVDKFRVGAIEKEDALSRYESLARHSLRNKLKDMFVRSTITASDIDSLINDGGIQPSQGIKPPTYIQPSEGIQPPEGISPSLGIPNPQYIQPPQEFIDFWLSEGLKKRQEFLNKLSLQKAFR